MAADRPLQRRSLEELFARLDQADDSEDEFLQQIFEGAARRDPELPNLLRAGAIPRMLDATIVGVLRGSPGDAKGNERLLEMLSEYRFVLPRSQGGWVYHDNTRDALLADWRSSNQKRARFVELNDALAAFHEEIYAQTLQFDRNLDDVSALIAQANPERLRRLTGVVEAKMAGSLLEALYHHLMASPSSGIKFLQLSFHELETRNRLGVCQSLVSLARDFSQRLPVDKSEPTLLAWIEYFEARMAWKVSGYRDAPVELMFRRLLDREDLPPHLRAWALDDLASVYETQLEMDRALRTRLELMEQPFDIDVYNEPLRHSTLGRLYGALADYPSAMQQFQFAIQKAEELSDTRADMGVHARLELSSAYRELGDWPSAFEAGVEALYRARTSFRYDRFVQRRVALSLAQLLSTFDLPASDCAGTEAIALAGSDDRWGALSDHIELLIDNHRIRTARTWINRLEAELHERDSPSWVRLYLSYQRAMLYRHEGQMADAITAYSTLMDDTAELTGSHWLWMVALMQRGHARATAGQTAEALGDLSAARDEWTRRGWDVAASTTNILLADTLWKAGDVAAAKTVLDAVEAVIPPSISETRSTLLLVRGDLCERLGELPAALHHYAQALHITSARRQLEEQTSLMRKLAGIHSARAEWQRSAEYDRRAGLAAGQLAAADAYNTTGKELQAESENASGMLSFCDRDGDATTLDRARQLFDSATELDANNVWPLLNLGFTYAEQQDWQGAAQALERVLELSPAPMRTARLYRCMRDYVLNYAQQLAERGHAAEAATVVAATLDRLSQGLPAAQLAPARASHCALLALAGQPAAALDACRAALALAESEHPLSESIAPLIGAVNDYWTVDAVLQEVQDDPGAASALRDVALVTRTELGFRLDEILGLTVDRFAVEIPVVTPILVEVGDGLVPIVDSAQDGGVFLYQMIPAMRERILASTGVHVPGVRMQGDPGLPPDGYCIQVDEIPVLAGTAALGTSFAVLPAEAGAMDTHAELTDVHPLTGKRGLWILSKVSDDRTTGVDSLTTSQYLLHQIEHVLRARLVNYLGPQEVDMLVETWAEQDDTDLIASVLPDADARLRLTWILQALVDEHVPITKWRPLLLAIREAGGIKAPTRIVHRAVRAGLNDQLPGQQIGRRVVLIPAEHEAALLGSGHADPAAARNEPRHEFLRWLRQTITVSGPAITVVTATQDARELISSLARTENPLVTTLSAHELTPP
jgi:tetratricopeptide (TPR) repeat protein